VTRSRRALGALALAVCAVGAWAAPAAAHAELRSSDPADGAVLRTAPSQVRLTFTEPPDPTLSFVHVLDALGKGVEVGSPRPVPGDRFSIRTSLGSLPKGVYTVTWRTVSEADGHVTAGSFSFGVGESPIGATPPPGSAQPENPPPSVLAVVGRWCLYAGLAVLLAGGTTALLAFRGELPHRRATLMIASALVLVAGVSLILAERSVVGVPLGDLLRSGAGRRLEWLAAAAAAAAVLGVVAALRPGRVPAALAAAAAAAAMLARALGGHASGGSSLAGVEVVLQWIHLLGVGVWIGGLVWLVLVLGSPDAEQRAAQVRRFSTIAAVGLGAVAVTGVLRALNELGGWDGFVHVLRTGYGTTLAIKVAVSIVLIGLGATNRYRNVPRFASRGPVALRRTVAGELVLAVGIFSLTGVLTGLPPPSSLPATPEVRPLIVNGADFATTTKARLEITPGTVGPNRFVVRVTDYDTGDPVNADRVSLTFDLPNDPDVGSTIRLERGPSHTWVAQSTALAIVGDWNVTVLVQRPDGSTEVPLHVRPKVPPPTIEVSRQPGQPDLYTITFGTGVQIQSYVDPGGPGPNQLHVTAFDASGRELPLKGGKLSARGPDGTVPLDPIRFGAGHFAANLDITSGDWTFLIDLNARDGTELSARFREAFG
jgi:copper transport protein